MSPQATSLTHQPPVHTVNSVTAVTTVMCLEQGHVLDDTSVHFVVILGNFSRLNISV